MMNHRTMPLVVLSVLLISCRGREAGPPPEAMSLLGKELRPSLPSRSVLDQLAAAETSWRGDSTNPDKLIWYGRRLAYAGRFSDAIGAFTLGTERFPDDARFYRHRGHRFISTRQLDMAVVDLERAAELMQLRPDAVEPDGMPNAQNIPLTTLKSNIFYHLGLAYYLQRDWDHALEAYIRCRDLGLNDDNIVSATHWLYMILRRTGRPDDARNVLSPVDTGMTIIENHAYWRLCLFYKGLLTEAELTSEEGDAPAGDAVRYGLANWYLYNGETAKAETMFRQIERGPSWSSFGFIAAEAELAAPRPPVR